MIHKSNLVGLLLLVLVTGCNFNRNIQLALKTAGTNRRELEAVLSHYRETDSNPEKLRAAEFLIENIPAHYSFAENLEISTENALMGSDIANICKSNQIGNITAWVGIRYTVNGQTITIRDYVIQQLNTGKTPVIIQKEPNHWVVGTSINTNSQTVNYLDPKYTDYFGYNLQGSVSFNQIDCLVY